MRKFCVTSHLLLKFVSVQVVIPEAHLNYNGLYSENFVDRVVLVLAIHLTGHCIHVPSCHCSGD